jgi:hypothetical protein
MYQFRGSEAEQAFYSDIREKKKAASGVHSKTGKNGYVGKMRFPSDIMSRKEKYNYRKASKVMTTNMYDEILTRESFEALDNHEKKNHMQYWRTKYKIKEIQQAMGISNKVFYDIIEALDLPKGMRKKTREPRKAKVAVAAVTPKKEAAQEEAAVAVKEEPVVQEILVDGLHLVFNGTFESEHIIKRLNKFITLLDDETDDYYIELKLMQKVKTK